MLGLTTILLLYYRRLRADVIPVYRIINKIDKFDLSFFFINKIPSRHNSVRLMKPGALTAIRETVFHTELLIV